MTSNELTIPVVKGFSRNKKIYVWCPFCLKEHCYKSEGFIYPRCCNQDSPFRKTGFIVKKYKIVIE